MPACLLVDGYNVLRSSGLYAAQDGAEDDYGHAPLNASRESLIGDVAIFAQGRFAKADVTVVFDGAGNPSSDGERRETGGVGVIFSAAGVSADAVIEDMARSAAALGQDVLVVSSDAAMQWTVMGARVTRMSAAGFAQELRLLRAEISEHLDESRPKATLAERLDPKVRERLARMARGQGGGGA
jgi:predicted RNA-binding protein with PIN domain